MCVCVVVNIKSIELFLSLLEEQGTTKEILNFPLPLLSPLSYFNLSTMIIDRLRKIHQDKKDGQVNRRGRMGNEAIWLCMVYYLSGVIPCLIFSTI